jgi:hypothetical protein
MIRTLDDRIDWACLLTEPTVDALEGRLQHHSKAGILIDILPLSYQYRIWLSSSIHLHELLTQL